MKATELLTKLPYPVYFVCKETQRCHEIIFSEMPSPVENFYNQFVNARDNWSVQTYVNLKRQGLNVHIVPKYIPGKICVTTYEDLSIKDFSFNSYIVACRHDRGRPEIAEQCIVQNQLNIIDHTNHFLPHWSQPALKPRDFSRGSKVENMVYKGLAINLAKSFQSSEFTNQLQSLGCRLSVSPADRKSQIGYFQDYTDADIVLAVRNSTHYNLCIKPPSKLINAWFAGCPAILGPEPTYQQLCKSELDYIEVRSSEEVIANIKRLQDTPSLDMAMVENGLRRATEFTPERIAQLWYNLLSGPVAEGYERWLQQSLLHKIIGRPVQFTWRAFKHKRERQSFFHNIHHGARLFSE